MKRHIGGAAIAPEPARRDTRPRTNARRNASSPLNPRCAVIRCRCSRPARCSRASSTTRFGAAHDRPEVQGFVDTMRAMLNAHGLTPDAFAARVFDGIRDGRYWLIPQPETIDGVL
jgi:hypothetical protein